MKRTVFAKRYYYKSLSVFLIPQKMDEDQSF